MIAKAFRLCLASAFLAAVAYVPAIASTSNVTRATLPNGLQVVVVRDPLAPVVTAVLNYKVGSDVQRYPGQAHALEHMMFRGSSTVSESQLADISQLLGGDTDADTQGEITQYFFSVPSQYLDVALRLEASRATGLTISQKNWAIERGAIKNEVTQDDSVAVQHLLQRTILPSIFRGTPYANDTLGTLYSFNNQINSAQLLDYYHRWYHPNDAVYVIAGNVDGPATIRLVEKYFGSVPAAKLPARPRVALQPLHPAVYRVDSDQPYSLIAVAYRLPGYKSKDYAAAQILESVLNNQRSDVFGLVASGKALYAGVQDIESHPLATAAAALMVVPVTSDVDKSAAQLEAVLSAYRTTGVPADLVAVAKQRAIADAEFRNNSISDLAFAWSDAVAKEGLQSPDQALTELRNVSLADVNRVLRTYMVPQHAITAYAVPKNMGKINAHPSAGLAKESNKITILHHDPLPSWALAAFKNVSVPADTLAPSDTRLANGLRLIVVPERVSNTVSVRGSIASNEVLEAPADKLGVNDITAALFPFGTTTYSRLELRRQLDSIAAEVSAGPQFSLDVLSSKFDRGMALLADEELHPAFPESDFATVKQQEVGQLAGVMTAPAHLASVALAKALYPAGDPTQQFATPQTAGNVALSDVKSYYARAYRPDLTTIVVIGNVTPAMARATVARYFGSWSATGPKPNVQLGPVPNNKPASIDVPDTGRVQSQVQLVETVGLTRASSDWAAVSLGSAVLGAGGSSILFHDLRDVHGYVYGVNTTFAAGKQRSTFGIDFASDPNRIVPAQALAIADLKSLLRRPVSSQELVRGKTMVISEVPLRQQSFDGLAGSLLTYSLLGLPLDEATLDARRYAAATPQSVRAALARWIRPNDFVRVITGPAPK